MKVVIAAAGTGGHINPGIAIANKIMEKEPQSKIIFIGTGRGLEKDLVPRAGYELKTVEAYGINRKINLDNIKRLCKTIKAVGQAKKILKEFKPDIVIGTGGYICVSVCMAANQLKIPIILHESNAFPGVAVKVMAKKANEILLGFEEAKERISNARKIVVTGTPTKVNSNRLSDEQKYNLKQEMKLKQDLPVVLFFGGGEFGLGKNYTLKVFETFVKDSADIQIIAISGKNRKMKEAFENIVIENHKEANVQIFEYTNKVPEFMSISNLVVTKPGGLTTSESLASGLPIVVINPIPGQEEENAEYLVNHNTAIWLKKDDNVEEIINNLLSDTSKLEEMSNNAKSISKPNSTNDICKILLNN